MRIINSKLVEISLSIEVKDEEIVHAPINHMEITLEDNSILVLESTDEYYKFISDAEVSFGTEEVFTDNIFKDNYKIYLAGIKLENGDTISSIIVGEYNGKDIYLIQIKKGE